MPIEFVNKVSPQMGQKKNMLQFTTWRGPTATVIIMELSDRRECWDKKPFRKHWSQLRMATGPAPGTPSPTTR